MSTQSPSPLDPESVATLVARRAGETPDAVAFVDGDSGEVRTWAALATKAESWRHLGGRVGPDARLGVACAEPLDMVDALIGALTAGVTVAPLDPDATPGERDRQRRVLGLSALAGDQPAPYDVPPAGTATAAGRAALILASSGTTGDPKIIPLTERQLLGTARSVVAHHGLRPDDRGYSPLPLFHINAVVVGVLSTLVAGSSLVVTKKFSARRFWSVAAEHDVTWVNLVPAIISVLAGQAAPPAEVAGRIGFARSASAPLPAATRERFERLTGIGVLETYGMTEAASQITANPRDPAQRRPGSVGVPVGLGVRVVDDAGRPVRAGVAGEVQISGPCVVAEYWSPQGARPARRGATTGGWLATGDLGRLDAGGYLHLAGRVDDVINRGGEKVFPRAVEEVLVHDPDVTSAAVVGRPDPTFGQVPVAFVLTREGADPDTVVARLTAACAEQLSRFRRPAAITVAECLPAGPTGKIRHSELRRVLAAAASGS